MFQFRLYTNHCSYLLWVQRFTWFLRHSIISIAYSYNELIQCNLRQGVFQFFSIYLFQCLETIFLQALDLLEKNFFRFFIFWITPKIPPLTFILQLSCLKFSSAPRCQNGVLNFLEPTLLYKDLSILHYQFWIIHFFQQCM